MTPAKPKFEFNPLDLDQSYDITSFLERRQLPGFFSLSPTSAAKRYTRLFDEYCNRIRAVAGAKTVSAEQYAQDAWRGLEVFLLFHCIAYPTTKQALDYDYVLNSLEGLDKSHVTSSIQISFDIIRAGLRIRQKCADDMDIVYLCHVFKHASSKALNALQPLLTPAIAIHLARKYCASSNLATPVAQEPMLWRVISRQLNTNMITPQTNLVDLLVGKFSFLHDSEEDSEDDYDGMFEVHEAAFVALCELLKRHPNWVEDRHVQDIIPMLENDSFIYPYNTILLLNQIVETQPALLLLRRLTPVTHATLMRMTEDWIFIEEINDESKLAEFRLCVKNILAPSFSVEHYQNLYQRFISEDAEQEEAFSKRVALNMLAAFSKHRDDWLEMLPETFAERVIAFCIRDIPYFQEGEKEPIEALLNALLKRSGMNIQAQSFQEITQEVIQKLAGLLAWESSAMLCDLWLILFHSGVLNETQRDLYLKTLQQHVFVYGSKVKEYSNQEELLLILNQYRSTPQGAYSYALILNQMIERCEHIVNKVLSDVEPQQLPAEIYMIEQQLTYLSQDDITIFLTRISTKANDLASHSSSLETQIWRTVLYTFRFFSPHIWFKTMLTIEPDLAFNLLNELNRLDLFIQQNNLYIQSILGVLGSLVECDACTHLITEEYKKTLIHFILDFKENLDKKAALRAAHDIQENDEQLFEQGKAILNILSSPFKNLMKRHSIQPLQVLKTRWTLILDLYLNDSEFAWLKEEILRSIESDHVPYLISCLEDNLNSSRKTRAFLLLNELVQRIPNRLENLDASSLEKIAFFAQSNKKYLLDNLFACNGPNYKYQTLCLKVLTLVLKRKELFTSEECAAIYAFMKRQPPQFSPECWFEWDRSIVRDFQFLHLQLSTNEEEKQQFRRSMDQIIVSDTMFRQVVSRPSEDDSLLTALLQQKNQWQSGEEYPMDVVTSSL